jgi:DnaJ-class molecular chaperone
MYDQCGHDSENNNMAQGGGGRGGFPGFAHGNMHEVSPEDLFNLFFQSAGPQFKAQFGRGGGGMRGRGFHAREEHDERGGRRGAGQQQGQPSLFQQLLQFLPVIIMLLITFSSYGSNYNQPVFALSPQGVYQRERATTSRGVSQDIKYYVNSQFEQVYRANTDSFRRLEKEVEAEYKQYIGMKCNNEKSYKTNKIYQVGVLLFCRKFR